MLPDIPGFPVKDRAHLHKLQDSVSNLLGGVSSPLRFPGSVQLFITKATRFFRLLTYC
jgi:hypothetical protein